MKSPVKLCLKTLKSQLYPERRSQFVRLFDPAQILMVIVCLLIAMTAAFSCGPKRVVDPNDTSTKQPPSGREQWRNAILGIQDGVKVLNGICLKEAKRLDTIDTPSGTYGDAGIAATRAGKLAKTCADAFDAAMGSLYSGALIVDTFEFAKVGALACTISRASAAMHTLAAAVVTVVGDAAKLPAVAIDGLKTADDFSAFVAGGCTDGK